MTPKELGSLLRHKRTAAGLTQKQAAQHCGLILNTYVSWENGCGLEKVARYFTVLEDFDCQLVIRKTKNKPIP